MISIDLLIGRYPKLVGCRDSILDAAALLEETFRSGGTLYTCGNGGSAADADHIVGELAKGFLKKRPVPESLKNKTLYALDMGALIAGAKFRGEFEERLKSVLAEISKSDGQILLFIDEVHTVVGAGASEGSMDAGNLLKPMLARGELRCIGATTLNEYRKYIEKDAALE